MDSFLRDVRFAWRMLVKSPGFTVVAILTLALGIGANVATFSIVYAVLLRPLPFAHQEELVRVFDDLRGSNVPNVGMSVPELWDFQQRSGVFDQISVVWPISADLSGGDRPERIEALATSPNYFTLLGAQPRIGRVYTDQDAVPGFLDGVILSDGFWRREFGADPKILGKKASGAANLAPIPRFSAKKFVSITTLTPCLGSCRRTSVIREERSRRTWTHGSPPVTTLIRSLIQHSVPSE